MRYEILDNNEIVVNTILADEEFVAREYPGRYRLAAFQSEIIEVGITLDPVQEKLDIIIDKLEKLEKSK